MVKLLASCSLALVVAAAMLATACGGDDTAAPSSDAGEAGGLDDASLTDGSTASDGNGGADVRNDVTTDAGDAGADAEAGPASCLNRLPGSFGSNTCNKCVGAKCCAVLDKCTAAQGCNGALMCNLPCLNEADAGGCFRTCIATTDGGNEYLALQDCWFNNECGVPCFF
jgi:hypothetical protein